MAAHLRRLPEPRCQWMSCNRRATEQLFNTWNAPQGAYCGSHAERALKRFIAEHPDHAAEPMRGGAR